MEKVLSSAHDLPWPFDTYPKDHEELKKPAWVGSNCRRGYGMEHLRKTGQSHCAYCGASFYKFKTWLTMALDHVVPVSVCEDLDIIKNGWCRSLANSVLACDACNEFCNRYTTDKKDRPATFEKFLELRNEIFTERKTLILKRRADEKDFFLREVAGRIGSQR
jgi:5-methylcytosine-specific restriction endonuclease McrA